MLAQSKKHFQNFPKMIIQHPRFYVSRTSYGIYNLRKTKVQNIKYQKKNNNKPNIL